MSREYFQKRLHAASGEFDAQACLQVLDAAKLAPADPAHLRQLLNAVGSKARCRQCNEEIWWIEHLNGKKACYTAAGLNHMADCPYAKDFKGKKPA